VALRIEDYGIIGDTGTAALVGRDGSIDWLCFPRFDSAACFAALLGGPEHGRWQIAPAGVCTATRRRYRDGTLVLETEMDVAGGTVRIIDFMPVRGEAPDVVRIVEGVSGTVPMRMELTMRFDYGWIVPWVSRREGALSAVAGPDALLLRTPVRTRGVAMTTIAEFEVTAGDRVPFVLTWYPSFRELPKPIDAEEALTDTERWWREWSDQSTCRGEFAEPVNRSLITLKALTYAPTGGIVAAPTTSLPEKLGGIRNWDYRYCWLRDATFTLWAFLLAGFRDEAGAWRDWLLRAVAGDPSRLQIMYGPAGERRLPETEIDWLRGYEGSRPVRIGNGAVQQFQLDVYGEVNDALYQARKVECAGDDAAAWALQTKLLEFLETAWDEPDEGIWEVRGPRRQFTHSKVMAWVAFDRGVRMINRFGMPGPVDRWRNLRDDLHRVVCEQGYDADRGAFTQFFGGKTLDASVLLIPLVGFLRPDDERVVNTVAAIQRELTTEDGFVMRYAHEGDVCEIDGLPAGEGAFLACTFWLADNLALQGRIAEGRRLFDRLLAVRNDVGLLSEEYDPVTRRQLGNFPQAYSHVSLVNTARNLTKAEAHWPVVQRTDEWPDV
jgi:GH15 family glucan-1,4-alpha-glucosidase